MPKSRKRALVLSGGGAKGSIQLGMLDFLINEKKLEFDIITGISVGALNALLVAQGDFDILRKIWFDIKGNRDVYRNKIFWFARFPWLEGYYDFKPLRSLMDRYFSREKLVNQAKKLRIGVVSLQKPDILYIDESHPDLKDYVFASATIPVIADPVKIEEMQFIDGGVVDIVPLKCAVDLGADEIYVLLASPLALQKEERVYKNLFEIAMRSFDIIMNEIMRNDVKTVLKVNKILETFGTYKNYRHIDIHFFTPEQAVIGTLEFNPDKIRNAHSHGYSIAEKLYEERIRKDKCI